MHNTVNTCTKCPTWCFKKNSTFQQLHCKTFDSARSCCYTTDPRNCQNKAEKGINVMQSTEGPLETRLALLVVIVLVPCCRTRTENRWWLTERRVCWTSWTRQVRRSTAPWGISTWGQERASSACSPSTTSSPLRTFTSTGTRCRFSVCFNYCTILYPACSDSECSMTRLLPEE